MTKFTMTTDRNKWPNWLHSAWELEWDTPGGVQPVEGAVGSYEAIGKLSGKATRFQIGDEISEAILL